MIQLRVKFDVTENKLDYYCVCIGSAAACFDKQQSPAVAADALGAAITAEWGGICTSASARND